MFERSRRLLPDPSERAWPLYGAAFATGLSLSTAWSAMSFVLIAMGGTKAHVGDAPTVNILAYMVALLLTGSRLGHLDARRATRVATVVATLAAMMMALAVFAGTGGGGATRRVWIWMVIASGGLGGAAMALFWPFLMSWVSGSYEGLDLNRRLGRYNGSWSSGGVVGPLVGAWLVERGPVWPMLAAIVCFAVSFVLLGLARKSRNVERGMQNAESPPCPIPRSAIGRSRSRRQACGLSLDVANRLVLCVGCVCDCQVAVCPGVH